MSAVAQPAPGRDVSILAGQAPATPAQFLRWLHGDLRHRVCVVSRIERADEPGVATFRDHTIRPDDLPWHLGSPDVWLESPDTYVMINETRRQRLASDVVCLKAFVVDLDCHHDGDLEPVAARDQALTRLDAVGLPRPHLCVETGRGVQLIWRVGRVGLRKSHRNAQVRWAKTQQALARICGPQADLSLVDLPRVIRLPGTVNTKAPPERRITRSSWVPGASPADYCFDDLCDAALGVRRSAFVTGYAKRVATNDEIISAVDAAIDGVGAQKAKAHKAREARAAGATTGYESLATIAAARLRDMEKIAQRFFMSGIPEGYRDTFCMAVATDLSWVTPLQQADAFADLVIHRLKLMGCVVDERTRSAYLGRVNAPLSVTEARRNMAAVVQRFRDAAAGAKVDFAGQLRDPRYWYRTERKWSLIGPLIAGDHELLGNLEELLPRHMRQARKARGSDAGDSGRQRSQRARDRVAEGRYRRARSNDAQRNQALEAIDDGMDVQSAASLARVTSRTIYNWLAKRAAAAVGPQRPDAEPAVEPADEPDAELITVVGPELAPQQLFDEAHADTVRPVEQQDPSVKKRPLPYMAKPGGFQALPQTPSAHPADSRVLPSLLPIKKVLVFGSSANERCGELSNSPALTRQPVAPVQPRVNSRVVHAPSSFAGTSEKGGGGRSGSMGARAGLPMPVPQVSQLPGVPGAANYLPRRGDQAARPMTSIGSVLTALKRRGMLPDAASSVPGSQPASPANLAVVRGSEKPSAPGPDGLAQVPRAAENDQDFGPPYADDR